MTTFVPISGADGGRPRASDTLVATVGEDAGHRMPELKVRAMTEAEFDECRLAVGHAYADEQVTSGNWSPDEALGLAVAGNAALLPRERATEAMLLLTAVRPERPAR